MPRIPIYTRTQSIPAKGTGALAGRGIMVSPDVAAAPARALSGLGSEMERVSFDIAKRYKEAEQFDELSTKTITAAKELNDLDFNLRQQENFDTVLEDFERNSTELRERYNEEIQDAQVKRRFAANFDRIALAKRTGLQIYRRNRQTDAYEANLYRNMEDYRDLMVSLSGPAREVEYADYMGRIETDVEAAARAGILTQVEAVDLLKKFGDQVIAARVERDILADPRQAYKDIVTGKYKDLDPESVTDLTKKARVEWEHQVIIAEKMDAQAMKVIRIQQEETAREMWTRVEKDLTLNEVNKALENKTVSLEEGKALQKAVRSELKESDPESLLMLNEAIRDNDPGVRTRILNSNEISANDKNILLGKLSNLQKPENRHDYNRVANTIKSFVVTEYGPMGQFVKADEIQAYNFAMNELDLRLSKGEGLWQAAAAILKKGDLMKPRAPLLKYGSIENMEAAEKLLVEAYVKQEIDQRTYELEAKRMETYLHDMAIYNNRLSILQQLGAVK